MGFIQAIGEAGPMIAAYPVAAVTVIVASLVTGAAGAWWLARERIALLKERLEAIHADRPKPAKRLSLMRLIHWARQSDYRYWQAAFLWYGYEPPTLQAGHHPEPGVAPCAAITDMPDRLREALQMRFFDEGETVERIEIGTNEKKTYFNRSALKRWAKTQGSVPLFLWF